MTNFLELTVNKFTFKVADDRLYTPEGVWALAEGNRIRIGLSDFQQQRNGDVAFAEIKPVGSRVSFSEEVAVIETIKVDISFGSPVVGRIVEVNTALENAPEAINQDPYGEGWMAIIEAEDWQSNRSRLHDAQAYFTHIRAQAEEEAKRG